MSDFFKEHKNCKLTISLEYPMGTASLFTVEEFAQAMEERVMKKVEERIICHERLHGRIE